MFIWTISDAIGVVLIVACILLWALAAMFEKNQRKKKQTLCRHHDRQKRIDGTSFCKNCKKTYPA